MYVPRPEFVVACLFIVGQAGIETFVHVSAHEPPLCEEALAFLRRYTVESVLFVQYHHLRVVTPHQRSEERVAPFGSAVYRGHIVIRMGNGRFGARKDTLGQFPLGVYAAYHVAGIGLAFFVIVVKLGIDEAHAQTVACPYLEAVPDTACEPSGGYSVVYILVFLPPVSGSGYRRR